MKRPNLSDSVDLFLCGAKVGRPPYNTTAQGVIFHAFLQEEAECLSPLSIYTVTYSALHKPRSQFFPCSSQHRRDDPWLFFTRNFYFQVKQDIKNRSAQLRAAARALLVTLFEKMSAVSWKERVPIM
jgi:hypothetical protein